MSHPAENGLPVEVAAALARVPTCGWHHGQYPDLCWWCGLNRVRVLPSGRGAFYEDHERDMQDPEYREAFEQATRDFPPDGTDPNHPIVHRPGCSWETTPYCDCGADPERSVPPDKEVER